MRRAESDTHQKIERLIEDEQDPRERVRLVVLHQISTVLADNVAAVSKMNTEFIDHRDDYEKHIARETAILNQGRGMLRVLGLVLVGAQSLLGYLYYQHVDAVRELQAITAGNSKEIEIIRERHRIEDRVGKQP
jgi:hypothetical protein